MTVNFFPNREQMKREVDLCVASCMLDVLMGYCKCCVYKVFDENTLVSECRACSVRAGIEKILIDKQWNAAPDLEFLGVC